GATVEVVPGYYDDALAASRDHAEATGARFLHAFDQTEMILGAGTLGAELASQAEVDRVVVAVGGGGLIGGRGAVGRDAGTRGAERASQAEVDRVVVAVGGGGLIGGVASWYRDDVAVTGVETAGCRTLRAALGAGRPGGVGIA